MRTIIDIVIIGVLVLSIPAHSFFVLQKIKWIGRTLSDCSNMAQNHGCQPVEVGLRSDGVVVWR